MCRNLRSIEWYQKTYVQISWDYPSLTREQWGCLDFRLQLKIHPAS
jgi:hypothetical protein